MEGGEKKFKNYSAASDDLKKEARSQFDAALGDLESSFRQTSSQILPEKEALEWKAQDVSQDMKYQLQQLRAASQNASQETEIKLKYQIGELEKRQREMTAQIKELETAKKDSWKTSETKVDKISQQFNARYRDVLTSLRPQ